MAAVETDGRLRDEVHAAAVFQRTQAIWAADTVLGTKNLL